MAKKSISETKRARPDFSGVPGELVDASVLPAGLHWGTKLRGSPYDGLLRQLAEAGTGKVLKFGNPKARVSVNVRARKLGMRVTCAEADGVLFVRFGGSAGEDLKGSRRERIRGVLKVSAGATPFHVAKVLRDKGDEHADAQIVEAILTQMARAGEVVRGEGDQWRLNPRQRAE